MWLARLTRVIGQVARPYWRLRLVGRTDAIPRGGPLVLASNHASFLDPWLILLVFPRRMRFLVTRRWYDRSPFWHWFFRANGTIPINPGSPGRTIDSACSALERGETVGIFPEGAISHDGRIQPFHAGLSRIAARSGAPVLPIGLRGNFESLPRQKRWPRPVRIEIHVGEPLRFPGAPIGGPPPREASERFQEQVLREICRLAGQEERAQEILGAARRTRRRPDVELAGGSSREPAGS